jgi:uncharacterized protein YdhG (YjbR/CyaY superfamily)
MAGTAKGTSTQTSARGAASGGFSEDEKAAMRERAKEVRAARKKGAKDGEAELLAKIAEMPEPDRGMAERIHAIVRQHAPELDPTTWYGMPAYAIDGKAVVFFQPAGKFKARYSTLGFNDGAKLDEGTMWPTSYAILRLTAADEQRIAELVKRAAG